MKYLLTFFCLILTTLTFSQNEYNVWLFGRAGLNFNTEPTSLAGGIMNALEGCSSICNKDGELLFYTDGIKIWNKNNFIMLNGNALIGSYTATQAALIVRKPNSLNIYYVITVPIHTGSVSYSEVNMTLDGGLGGVTANKNIPITNVNSSERVCAIRHQNGTDIWIIIPTDDNIFQSFLLTSFGISSNPTFSSFNNLLNGYSSNPNFVFNNSIGYLKGSYNGERIAMVNFYNRQVGVFDFDNNTGILSNPMTFYFSYTSGVTYPYGVEFSPSGDLLYVSSTYNYYGSGGNTMEIHQFNLLAGSQIEIDTTRVVVGINHSRGGAIMLGPDMKIYQSNYKYDYLSVINKPDEIGHNCNYDSTAIEFFYDSPNDGHLGFARHGLPNTINTLSMDPSENILIKNYCYQDSTSFTFNSIYYDSLTWDFGDVNSGIDNYSTLDDPLHLFSDTGIFNITIYVHSELAPDTVFRQVHIVPGADFSLGNDTTLCTNDIQIINIANPNSFYLWQDGSTDSIFTITEEGTYWASVFQNFCLKFDSITVKYSDLPDIAILENDTTLCNDETLTLHTLSSFTDINYLWQDSSTLKSFDVDYSSGTYMVTVSNVCGENSDEVKIDYNECRCELIMPNAFTPNSDNLNETFFPLLKYGNAEIISFNIYNRWGHIVHSTLEPWNGKVENIQQKTDVYTYYIQYKCQNETRFVNGVITLLK